MTELLVTLSNISAKGIYITRSVLQVTIKVSYFKGKDQLWSCDCIMKETLWNRSEKVDHLAYKYWCVLQGSGIIKMIRNMAQSS